jgi:hypothetical protein
MTMITGTRSDEDETCRVEAIGVSDVSIAEDPCRARGYLLEDIFEPPGLRYVLDTSLLPLACRGRHRNGLRHRLSIRAHAGMAQS